jgi:hypothetical protein
MKGPTAAAHYMVAVVAVEEVGHCVVAIRLLAMVGRKELAAVEEHSTAVVEEAGHIAVAIRLLAMIDRKGRGTAVQEDTTAVIEEAGHIAVAIHLLGVVVGRKRWAAVEEDPNGAEEERHFEVADRLAVVGMSDETEVDQDSTVEHWL